MASIYQPKVTKVEALQWTGENLEEILDFTGRFHLERRGITPEMCKQMVDSEGLIIHSPYPVKVFKSDYIVKHEANLFQIVPSWVIEKHYEIAAPNPERSVATDAK